jgi:hypothetical protein
VQPILHSTAAGVHIVLRRTNAKRAGRPGVRFIALPESLRQPARVLYFFSDNGCGVCGTQKDSIAPTAKPWQAMFEGENLQVIHIAVTSP